MDITIPSEKSELDDFSHRLVGKFFTNSTPPSLEETESSLRQQWRLILPENMTIRTQDNDRLLFDFKQEEDKEFVLSNGPWVVNGVMLVIKEFTSEVIDFTVTELHVTVVGLPIYYHFREQVYSDIQTLFSNKPLVIKRIKGMRLCFQTEIDLKKPLNPGFYVSENRFVEFKYKNIGDFCYNCGIIGHVKSDCDQELPEERTLNATSKTPVYGPWIISSKFPNRYEMALKLGNEEKTEDVKECEKTLSYPQFFIQLNFNVVNFNVGVVCNTDSKLCKTLSHSFRFPCSYLDSTDLTISKAREVIENEISENARFPLPEFEDMSVNWPLKEKSNVICSLLEYLNVIRKNSEEKWLSLKLEITSIHTLTSVDYQTLFDCVKDFYCVQEIEMKMSDLVKKKVEEKDNLFCLNLWETEIKKVLAEIGYNDYPYLFDVSTRAEEAMKEAIEMARSCPIRAEKEAVEKLERKKVIGSEIDELDPCVICSQEMFLSEEVIVLPCSHVFHSLCVLKWFQVGHKCPLCGFKLPLQK